MTERKASQVAAEQKYFEKRKSKPRLPGGYISDEENDLLERVAGNFSTKKERLIYGALHI